MTQDEKLKLAEQIVEELYPPDHRGAFRSYQRGAGISAAIAAIEATGKLIEARDVAIVEQVIADAREGEIDNDLRCVRDIIVGAIQAGAYPKQKPSQ